MLPCRQEIARHRVVQAFRGGRDVDGLDVLAQELAIVLAGARRLELVLEIVQASGIDFGEVQLAHQRMSGKRLRPDAAAPAGAYYRNRDGLHWFTLMLASRISLAYLSCSALMKAANSAGVLLTASTPRSAKRFFTSASPSALTVSACSLSTTARGVPAGYSTPHQLTATSPGAAPWHGGGSGSSS